MSFSSLVLVVACFASVVLPFGLSLILRCDPVDETPEESESPDIEEKEKLTVSGVCRSGIGWLFWPLIRTGPFISMISIFLG